MNKTALNCNIFTGAGPLSNLVSIVIQPLSKFYVFCNVCDAPHCFHSKAGDNTKLVQDILKHNYAKHDMHLKAADIRNANFPGGKPHC